MKKYMFLMLVLFVLMLSCSAFAADGEWTAWDADLSDAAEIKCTFADSTLENEEVKAILGEITEDDWAIGPEDALMTLVEYADFQCPYCSRAGLIALEFQAAHPDEVRYVYRHFPLSFHEKAPMSAYAADAAGKQGLFFDAEEWLYETQSDWTYIETLDEFDAWLRENIQTALPELDFEQWETDYESEEVRNVVDGSFDKVAATNLISGTPTFFANFYQTSYEPAVLEQYIDLFKMQKNYRTACPVMSVEEGKEYRAVLHTSTGDVVIDLLSADAPNLVSNFMQLAKDGYYNGNSFHNVVTGFIAQTGDPSATGVGLTGYYLDDENLNNAAFTKPGAVAMANTGENKNSSQFFIAQDLVTYFYDGYAAQNPDLSEDELNTRVQARLDAMDARYPVFGRVAEESLEVLPLIDTTTVIESVDIEVRG
ncbi:MAG: peptidylprolyl isomerase [Anaerolineaceae bacterium]|nr:peptidylprolyl isomerase [Anaerolineaceae bacterium]